MNFTPEFEKKTQEHELIEKYMVPLSQMVTFKPDQDIHEAIAVILKERISGAPVVDEHRHLVGNLSEKDCLQIIVDQVRNNIPVESRKVSDYMSTKVFAFSLKTNVVEAAMEFLNSPIRRYAIVDKGVLIGQISRREILLATKNIGSW